MHHHCSCRCPTSQGAAPDVTVPTMAKASAAGLPHVRCCMQVAIRHELTEHLVTTGDIGLPATLLRGEFPQVGGYQGLSVLCGKQSTCTAEQQLAFVCSCSMRWQRCQSGGGLRRTATTACPASLGRRNPSVPFRSATFPCRNLSFTTVCVHLVHGHRYPTGANQRVS